MSLQDTAKDTPIDLGPRYELQELLGEGAVGRVFRARDRWFDHRPVAVKVLHPDALTPETMRDFQEEFASLARFQHPNLVQVYDFGPVADASTHFLSMELLSGRTLLDRRLPLDRDTTLSLLLQLAQALDYIHTRGFLHQDIKPGNVLLAGEGDHPLAVKLADFGMALGPGPEGPAALQGTLHFMAPERFAGGLADPRSDLYSLGALLFQMITGTPPFADIPSRDLVDRMMQGPPDLPAGVQSDLGDVVRTLMEPFPARRYPSTAALVDAVNRSTGAGLELDTQATRHSLVHGGPLVARSQELEALRACVDGLASPQRPAPALTVLCGEAGIGKTRLMQETLLHAQVGGVHVLEGSFAGTRQSPLGPWPEILQRLSARLERMPEIPEPLAALQEKVEPLWQAAYGADARSTPDPTAKQRLLSRLTDWMHAACRQVPTLLCLEDLPEASPLAWELLWRLAGARAPVALRMVATAQETDEGRARELRRRLAATGGQRLELQRLEPAGIAQWLTATLALPDPPDVLVSALHERTGGNPLLLEESLAGLIAAGRVVRGPEGWSLHGEIDAAHELPAGMDELLDQRLTRLSTPETRVLEALAVATISLTSAELAAVLELEPWEAERTLGRLSLRGVVEELASAPSEASCFCLGDSLLSQALVQRCSGKRRQDLHGRFARALAGRNNAALLALHHAGAGHRDEAVCFAEQAAEAAMVVHAYEAAIPFYRQALTFAEGRSALRSRLLERLALAQEAIGASSRAVEAYREALAAQGEPSHTDREAALAERIGWNASQAGDFETAVTYAARALDLFHSRNDELGEARARKTLGVALSRKGDLDAAQQHYEQALQALEGLESPAEVAGVLNNLGLLQSFRGDGDGAIDYLTRSLELRRSIGDAAGQVGPLLNLGFVRAQQGDHQGALETFDECIALTKDVGDLQNRGNALMHRAESLRSLGILDGAQSSWEEALRIHRETDDLARELHCYDRLGDLHRSLVQPAVAAEHHRRALELARELGDPVQEAFALASLGLDQLGLGEPDAGSNLEAALEAARRRDNRRVEARALRGLSLADAMRGEWAAMAARSDRLILVADAASLEEDRVWGQRLLGEAQLGLGQIEAGRRTLQEAASSARHALQPQLQRESELLLAESLQKGGRLGDALDARMRAQGILEEMSMKIRDEQRRSEFLSRAGKPASSAPASASQAGSSPSLPAGLGGLYEISQAMNSILEPEKLLEEVMDLAIERLNADRGVLILFDGPGGEMRVRVARNTERETLDDAIAYSRHVVREAADGRPVLSVDVGEDERFRDFRSVRMYGIRSLLCVPLRLRGEVVGTVYLDSRRPTVAFTEEGLHFLEIFANMAALALHNAQAFDGLRKENRRLREEMEGRFSYGNMVGKSQKLQDVFQIMKKVTESTLPVLILGESGTGKELVARSIHFNGPRKDARFCSQNCAALPEPLLESELFGHVKGAFTGAEASRAGLFELADGGTLFLDEIGDMSLPMQGKVLRAVQDGEIRPVGGRKTVNVDVRFLSATNKDLEQLLKEGLFREDLYFRLNVVRLTLPPLRDRKEDIPLLAEHFLAKEAGAAGRAPKRLAEDALALLLRYHWPGNVRELENEIKKLTVFSAGEVISLEDINEHQELFQKLTDLSVDSPLESIEEVERKQIVRALLETGGHRGKAAHLLGISRATIFRKIKAFGISV
jgi:Nif-specific regulatory protein